MRVIVAGGGIGGLALALAAGQCGLAVTVLEQAVSFLEVGAGLQLPPNAVKALQALGLEGAVASVATRPEAVEVCDQATGRRLLHTPLGASAVTRWGAPYFQVHRADLHALLLEAVSARPEVELVRGARVAQVGTGVRGAEITLESGNRLAADVVVGCDGVRSLVREAIVGNAPARFTGQVAWRGLVPSALLDADLAAPETTVWTGPGRHFVHYPVRRGALVNFIAVTEERAWQTESWSEEGRQEVLSEAFSSWPSSVRSLIDAAPRVMRWALYDRPPLATWSRGPLALLGDAAHPMLPFLAQGAAMALEDAVVLSACLAEAGKDGEGAASALMRYERHRKGRTSKVQAWSSRNAHLFHLPSPLARAAFGLASVVDRVRHIPGAQRLDWLYGYDPVSAV